MPVHFSDHEMQQRQSRAAAAVAATGLDALLIFKQESMYWLTGYDTFGFSMFQCLVLTASGDCSLLTRAPDRATAIYTSNITDIHVWADKEGMNPAQDLRALMTQLNLRGCHVGIELDSYGLKASSFLMLQQELDGFATWTDASSLIQELRRTKSEQEIVYLRRAAELADDAWQTARETAGAGVNDAQVLANMQQTILAGGGDYAGNELIIGSGPAALMVRYTSGRRVLSETDQLTLEWCGVQRRYHAAMMRTATVGSPSVKQRAMHQACEQALLACESTIKPGATLGAVFDAHARELDNHGFRAHRMNACGYGMGAVYAPIWVDWPMFYHGNPLTLEANQVYFLHMILIDLPDQLAMTLGHSVLVTEQGCERLSQSTLDLFSA